MKQALIVEDIPETRLWLVNILEETFPGIAIRTTATLQERQRLLDGAPLDLALIDLNLPAGFGADFIYEIKTQLPQTLCVVATAFDDDPHLFPALQAGADGYLLKDMPAAQIQALLLGIEAGTPPLSPSIARRLIHYFTPSPSTTHQAPSSADLIPREQETLTLIAKGLSIREAAELMGLGQHTVGGYIKEVYHKLGLSSRTEAALEAGRLGPFGAGD